MLSEGFKTLKITTIVLVTFLLLPTAFSHILIPNKVHPNLTGAYPVPGLWLGNPSVIAQTRLELNFSLYTANWSNTIVTKDAAWWGVPANPAENIFYLPEEIPPFLNLIFDYTAWNMGFYLELPLKKEYRNTLLTLSDGNNLPFNLLNPLDMSKLSVDLNFPTIGYIYYANERLFFAVGRFPLKWGDAKFPVHISPTTYQDNATFAIRFSGMTYTFHAITSYPLLSPNEYHIQTHYSDQHTSGRYFYEPSKWIIAHRLDFYNMYGDVNLRVGFGELNIVGGKHLDLIDLNPILIYHNTYGEGYRNVTGSVDFSFVWKSLNLYGEFVVDDAKTPTEYNSSYKPSASAYNMGIKLDFDALSLWFEYAETSEWMYVTNYLPYLRINVRHFDLENNPGVRFMFDYPLGFIYGPDAKMFSFGLEGNLLGADFQVMYNLLTKGLVDDNGTIRWKWFWDSWPGNVSEPGATTPPKAREKNYNIFSLKLTWQNFTVFYKTIDFDKYFLSVNYKNTF
jgi:hypothetical protein